MTSIKQPTVGKKYVDKEANSFFEMELVKIKLSGECILKGKYLQGSLKNEEITAHCHISEFWDHFEGEGNDES